MPSSILDSASLKIHPTGRVLSTSARTQLLPVTSVVERAAPLRRVAVRVAAVVRARAADAGGSVAQRCALGAHVLERCVDALLGTLLPPRMPVVLMTDDVFLGLGHDPRTYDCVVIKTPHAQPEMFDDWAYTNIGVDCPGATTADVSALGHTM